MLDLQGKVLSLNPAAGAILGSPVRRLVGRPLQDVLPGWVDIQWDFQLAATSLVELSLGIGADIRDFQVEVTSLNDWRGLAVARLANPGGTGVGDYAEEALTPRQIEILQLVAEGIPYKGIAERLFLSEHTVKYHIGEIMQRLHLKNRSQVLAYAARLRTNTCPIPPPAPQINAVFAICEPPDQESLPGLYHDQEKFGSA